MEDIVVGDDCRKEPYSNTNSLNKSDLGIIYLCFHCHRGIRVAGSSESHSNIYFDIHFMREHIINY